ncbi:hypothetical protein ADIS_1695 [Lunatimonas lonarensis]|uniref:Uncharacterized protein n=1 Tax=Lunatimonas lonarensis TaxID=1232681 RepID=R7ZUD6_9BACT|nr:hypothetical protein [Lunatimonas lonarensis]EON77776.1 hypothetical protein ADIS_1695 [Lunatimonas lonarensis]
MKFPSIFRVNQPHRFQITPRHYDPVKEEIQQRTERIKRELQQEGLIHPDEEDAETGIRYHGGSPIRGAFTQGSPIKRKPSSLFESTGMIRLIIMVLLIGGFGGYIYVGPDFLYYMLYLGVTVVAFFALFRLKSVTKK